MSVAREEAIRALAHRLWEDTGCEDATANWLLAEKLVDAECKYTFYKAVQVRADGSFWSRMSPTRFEVGKTYTVPGKPRLCSNGFHACGTIADCFRPEFGYRRATDAVLEVMLGPAVGDGIKICSTCMYVVRAVPEEEVNLAVPKLMPDSEEDTVASLPVKLWPRPVYHGLSFSS